MFPTCIHCGSPLEDSISEHRCPVYIPLREAKYAKVVDIFSETKPYSCLANEADNWYLVRVHDLEGEWWDLTYKVWRSSEFVMMMYVDDIDNWQFRDTGPRGTPERETWKSGHDKPAS